MARIVGGLATSHIPAIGGAIAKGLQQEPYWKPFFDGFDPAREWLAKEKPDAVVVFYNDHGLNFFLDKMPTFAVGAAAEYRNDDEGWGIPTLPPFKGIPELSWAIIDHLVAKDFDIVTCQEMLVDHAFTVPLKLFWPDGDAPAAVPVCINTVQFPLPSARRCYAMGKAVGEAIAAWDKDMKVVTIGSGGLSHQLEGQRAGFINKPFDLKFLDTHGGRPGMGDAVQHPGAGREDGHAGRRADQLARRAGGGLGRPDAQGLLELSHPDQQHRRRDAGARGGVRAARRKPILVAACRSRAPRQRKAGTASLLAETRGGGIIRLSRPRAPYGRNAPAATLRRDAPALTTLRISPSRNAPHDHRLSTVITRPRRRRWRPGATSRSPGSRTRPSCRRRPTSRSATTNSRESIETNQLKFMRERGADLTVFSPRASFMAHHIGDFAVSSTWAAICNELIHRVSKLFPDNFIGAAMLPQSPGVDPKTCIPELEKCVKDYGFVGINLNPDPSGGHWTSPPLTDRHWYPIYETDGRIRHPGDGACLDQLQRLLPHDRRPLHQRRHDRGDAAHPGRPLQGFPDAALRHPARRRRGALSLGPLPRPRPGIEEAAAQGSSAQERVLRHLRLPPAGHRPADQGDPGRQHSVRERNDRRGARHRSGDRPSTTTTPSATSRRRRTFRPRSATRSTRATRAASIRASTRR